jgi:hypothetical protein
MAWPAIIAVAALGTVVYEAIVDLMPKSKGSKKLPPPSPKDGTMTGDPALDMNALLQHYGYRRIDQPVYKLFQHKAGLNADGYPGTSTMTALRLDLSGRTPPVDMANVPVYPWLNVPNGWDGANAPTMQQWLSGSTPAGTT